MAILVTGGAGFVGSHVCEELIKTTQVVCADVFDSNYPESVKRNNIASMIGNDNFKLVEINITNKTALETLFQDHEIESVIHLAAKTGVRPSIENPKIYFDVNVNGTLNILDACRKYDVKKIVFASSSSVYGSVETPFLESGLTIPDSPYGVSKLAAENLCRIYNKLHGINVVCLRFFTVYGPRGRPDMAPYIFTEKISKDEPIKVFGDGSSIRDYTYVKDVVDGVLKALNADLGFEVINIGNSNPVKLLDFIAIIEKLVGKKANIQHEAEQPGDMGATFADMTKAEKLLNFKPTTSIEQGMAEFVKWYNETMK
ncbi:epimerase [Candidatus Woesearchaeota archaeon]|nr:epimerase [Candidatus Woesearchaeota archaeon]|tara:strand:+ start:13646 stop:14587 length:942 start_codon:yes stop_codon:yes gene_type:complete